jgi:hypothetical protein
LAEVEVLIVVSNEYAEGLDRGGNRGSLERSLLLNIGGPATLFSPAPGSCVSGSALTRVGYPHQRLLH